MKWIAKAFRHTNSLQIIIPKELTKEFKWGFNTHFVIEKNDEISVKITSLDDWAEPKIKKISGPINPSVNRTKDDEKYFQGRGDSDENN